MASSNFDCLKYHDELLVRLAQTAEFCFVPDPNTTLIKMRQLGEELAKTIASRVGVDSRADTKQIDLLRDLDFTLKLDTQIKDAFHTLRRLGNPAAHDITSSSHRDALKALQVGHALSAWFHVNFGGVEAKNFKLTPFVKPVDPSEKVRQLEETLHELYRQNKSAEERLAHAEKLKQTESLKAAAENQRAEKMASESKVWEEVATEHEATLVKYRAKMDEANVVYKLAFQSQAPKQQAEQIRRLEKSTLQLSEAETRILIDEQLIAAGWEADSVNLKYSKGARPVQNENRAIAEWPTESGPADYVLFIGVIPVAVVEAKKAAKNVYSSIDQSKRYAKDLLEQNTFTIRNLYGDFKVPLAFATNGRPYLKQLERESGIWFLDIRDSSNRRKALKGWYTPQEIKLYLRTDEKKANIELDAMTFDYNLKLRDYQINAIKSVENCIKQGKETALIAMATGTGKTKTAIAMIYRLLKSERFRRILFLVDRSALGVQATESFSEVRLENLITFSDTFEVMGMEQNKTQKPKLDNDTKVHVATVQGLVKRLLYPNDNNNKPSIGQYDCIVVDECHRGYLLDRELSETEILFRDQSDYQSKYRFVIEYFDAFKIGLTATPALHTTEIFGPPVFTYSYTEAVLDGHLNDHLPPVRIHTKLSERGIKYKANEDVKVYDAEKNTIETYKTPDELSFDVADFNRKIIAPEYTKAVTKWLIESDSIKPYFPAKTLVFCVTDKHADDVVEAFKTAIENYHGEVEDDSVQKITGASDKPLDKVRNFKSDRLPNIVVTVDLLTTGIDIPSICNLVFLRRVNSRILFEQMLGRATRLCPAIGKGPFHVYDAVDIYKQLEKVNTMKPVVTNVNIKFSDLAAEIITITAPDLQELAKNQFIAKLHVKKNFLSNEQIYKFVTITGKSPSEFAKELKSMTIEKAAAWFADNPGLSELLDQKHENSDGDKIKHNLIFHDGEDEFTRTTTGYGEGKKPEDYLNAFKDFINANSNRLQALKTVITKPWALSRQSLKELAIELDLNHFREKDLQIAWQEVKQEEIAARIIGFIRQAALGEALIPWEVRVDLALERILESQVWKTPQRDWLILIAEQMKATTIVDEATLDQGIFKHQGGIKRANKLFEQPAANMLEQFNRALWN
ncbi:type I restriction-modification system endonuclease [uncultured Pseudomonas sp.]|uniref:type I restriction-modification system endonuclease n=1 Tax=uncultured Pseudomonas sp. TaxID=114707 RepID=UPI0025DD89C8|nr:type I restriction-modification system endonuclease [uncultured Pseudomonas sp.]